MKSVYQTQLEQLRATLPATLSRNEQLLRLIILEQAELIEDLKADIQQNTKDIGLMVK